LGYTHRADRLSICGHRIISIVWHSQAVLMQGYTFLSSFLMLKHNASLCHPSTHHTNTILTSPASATTRTRSLHNLPQTLCQQTPRTPFFGSKWKCFDRSLTAHVRYPASSLRLKVCRGDPPGCPHPTRTDHLSPMVRLPYGLPAWNVVQTKGYVYPFSVRSIQVIHDPAKTKIRL